MSAISKPEITPLIAFDHVRRDFDEGRIVALHDANFGIHNGESVAVIGASGSGKTTMIMLMCGIMQPSSGAIRWQGEPVTEPADWTALRHKSIGIVFQDFNLFSTLSAAENVEIAMFGSAYPERERRKRVADALAAVGLTERATHLPHQLSGGERQRVAIARAIINDPTLILADEPTGNLDSVSGETIMDLLIELHQSRGTTLVIVTHNPGFAARCTRGIRVKDGLIAEEGKLVPSEVTL